MHEEQGANERMKQESSRNEGQEDRQKQEDL